MNLIYEQLQFFLLKIKHRNTLLFSLILIVLSIAMAVGVYLEESFTPSSAKTMGSILTQLVFLFLLLMQCTEIESGLCKKLLYNGWSRKKLFKNLFLSTFFLSIICVIFLSIFVLSIYLAKPHSFAYMQHFFSFKVLLGLFMLSQFSLFLSTIFRNVSTAITVQYFLLPLILLIPIKRIAERTGNDFLYLINPYALFVGLIENNLFLDSYIIISFIIGFSAIFSALSFWRINKMNF
ncbi:MAG: hypothetical protein ACJAT1_001594 [Marivirga sp.]|jgi:hypothetical protein